MAPLTTEATNQGVDEERSKATRRKPVPAVANTPEQSTPKRNRDPLGKRVEKFCQWALNVTALAAAIVFGIWAPLSYNITLNANSGNDASSSKMLSAVQAASSQASVAASTQSAMLDDLSSRIGAVGQLWLLDFCAAQTAISACQEFINEVDVPSLVTYLASTSLTVSSVISTQSATTIPGTFTNTAGGGTTSPTSGSGSGPGASAQISVPAILGIVFATLVVIGWLIGVYLFLSRRRRTADEVET